MVFSRSLCTNLLIFTIVFMSTTSQLAKATRPLDGEQWLKKQAPLLESLPAGPVPPSGGSGCTYIPGSGGGSCPSMNGMNFAGRAVRAPKFPAALMGVEAAKQDPSS